MWWWLTFSDETAPEGQQFRGVAIVGPAADVTSAALLAEQRGCNPGCRNVTGVPIGDAEAVRPNDRFRLLTRGDVEEVENRARDHFRTKKAVVGNFELARKREGKGWSLTIEWRGDGGVNPDATASLAEQNRAFIQRILNDAIQLLATHVPNVALEDHRETSEKLN